METEAASRMDSANDRLTTLKDVTNFGMPVEEFDSEGELSKLYWN